MKEKILNGELTFNSSIYEDVFDRSVTMSIRKLADINIVEQELDESEKTMILGDAQRDPSECTAKGMKSYILNLLFCVMAQKIKDDEMRRIEADLGIEMHVNDNACLPETICISYDPSTPVRQYEIQDGGHRLYNYIYKFIYGLVKIKKSDVFDATYLNEFKDWLFENIAEDVDEISYEMLPQDIKDKLDNIHVNVVFRASTDRAIRVALYQGANAGKSMSNIEKVKAEYGNEIGWKCMEAVSAACKAYAKKDSVEFFTKTSPVSYQNKNWDILKSTLKLGQKEVYYVIPRILLSGGYIPAKYSKGLEWTKGTSMTDVLDIFFKATKNMSTNEFNGMIKQMFDNTIWLGKNVFVMRNGESSAANYMAAIKLMDNTKKYQHITMALLDKKNMAKFRADALYRQAATMFIHYVNGNKDVVNQLDALYSQFNPNTVNCEQFISNPETYANTFQNISRVRNVTEKINEIVEMD